MKLTDKQERVLAALQEGKKCSYHPYSGRFNPNRYYYVDSVGKATREVDKLLELGLVEKCDDGYRSHSIKLTEEGKAYQCNHKKPIDVWVVDTGLYRLTIKKDVGYIEKNKFTDIKGYKRVISDSFNVFLDRDSAYQFLINKQKNIINGLKGKIKWEEEILKEFEKQYSKGE